MHTSAGMHSRLFQLDKRPDAIDQRALRVLDIGVVVMMNDVVASEPIRGSVACSRV